MPKDQGKFDFSCHKPFNPNKPCGSSILRACLLQLSLMWFWLSERWRDWLPLLSGVLTFYLSINVILYIFLNSLPLLNSVLTGLGLDGVSGMMTQRLYGHSGLQLPEQRGILSGLLTRAAFPKSIVSLSTS